MKKDSSKSKTFPSGTHEESLKDANKKLRGKIRRLESDKRKLIEENKQYRIVMKKNVQHLKNSSDEFSLEEILEVVKLGKPLYDEDGNKQKVETICPDCHSIINPLHFAKFSIHNCGKCGYKKRIDK